MPFKTNEVTGKVTRQMFLVPNNSDDGERYENKSERIIYVNGVRTSIRKRKLSYGDIMKKAGFSGRDIAKGKTPKAYYCRPGKGKSGREKELRLGEKIKIYPGMSIRWK